MNKDKEKPQGARALLIEYFAEMVRVVLISLAIILPVRYFLIQPFYVKGASMEPTYNDHEYLIINEIAYRLREPERGEVVVFRYPNDPSQFFIKRVVGLPGETVVVGKGRVKILSAARSEGYYLDESDYLASGTYVAGDRRVTLGQNEFYVLGDNRGSSLDSRVFGPVPRKNIVGRVWLRGWPLEKAAVFKLPTYETQ